MRLLIDRLHINNHKGKKCRKHFDADKIEDLLNINTVVCEQTNFWLSHFKYIMKHMNAQRFNFFMYIILDKYNTEKIKNKIK